PAEEHNRTERRNSDHAGVFGNEEHRELEAGIFRMKSGYQLRFGFGQIEWHTIGLGDRSSEEADKSQNLRPYVPAEEAKLGVMRLRIDDVAQAEAAGHEQNADNGHCKREFVAHHLCRTAQSAEQRIFAVGGPSGKRDAINAQRGYREQREQA